MGSKKAAKPATENAAPEAEAPPAPERPGLVLDLPGGPHTPHIVHPHEKFGLGDDVQLLLGVEPVSIAELGIELAQAQEMHLDENCAVALVELPEPPADEQAATDESKE